MTENLTVFSGGIGSSDGCRYSKRSVVSPAFTARSRHDSVPASAPAPLPQPSDAEIRDYANHLHIQHGSVHGHDHADWLEAEACLRAGIPNKFYRTRLHHHIQISERATLGLIKHGRS